MDGLISNLDQVRPGKRDKFEPLFFLSSSRPGSLSMSHDRADSNITFINLKKKITYCDFHGDLNAIAAEELVIFRVFQLPFIFNIVGASEMSVLQFWSPPETINKMLFRSDSFLLLSV